MRHPPGSGYYGPGGMRTGTHAGAGAGGGTVSPILART